MGLSSLRLATSRFTLCYLSSSKGSLLLLGKRSKCLTDFSGCIEITGWRLVLLLLCDHEVIICTSAPSMVGKGSLCANRLSLRHGRLRWVALSRYWSVWVNILLSTSAKASRLPAQIPWFNLLSKASSSTFARCLLLS